MGAIFVKGQYRLLQNIGQLEQAVRDEVALATRVTAQRIASIAASRAPSATGGLKGSIRATVLRSGLTARVDALPGYALAVESGYKGILGRGNRGHGFPARKVGGKWEVQPELAAWARARGRSPWAVAQSVFLKGYKPQPFLFGAMQQEADAYLRALEAALTRAGNKVSVPAGANA